MKGEGCGVRGEVRARMVTSRRGARASAGVGIWGSVKVGPGWVASDKQLEVYCKVSCMSRISNSSSSHKDRGSSSGSR